jgi:RNA polymerase sigma factor (sigma-70 family)
MTPMPFTAPLARALLRSQSDERLVKLARDEHEGAFEEIVRRYRAPLVAFAAAYAPSERVEDVVQESLTNAWTALQGSDREIALKPWLYTIVRNRALNARRDTRYHSELDETADGVPRPDQIVLERDELSRAVAAIALLPDAQRKALVDSAIEGRTHDQIAAELGTSAGSVRGLIHRGRVAVRGAVGALVPFPVAAWAAGSGGAVGGTVAAGSVAGSSLAGKGAAVAAIAVLATGSGLVVERSLNDSAKSDREAGAAETSKANDRPDSKQSDQGGEDASGPGHEAANGANSNRGPNSGPGGEVNTSGPGGGDDDHSGHDGGDDDSSGPGSGDDDSGEDNSGHGGGDVDNSGPGSVDDGVDDNSGSGSGGDDESSGSGSGGDDPDSGSSGSGSSGSDSSSSGSSGSGSGDDEEDEVD